MSSDNANPLSPSLPDRRGFQVVKTISTDGKSLSDILFEILQHEEAGMPLVVRGLNADPNWSPPPRSGSPGEPGDGGPTPPVDNPGDQNTSPSKDAFTWIHQLSLIPKDLLPPGPKETSSVTVDRWGGSENEAVNHSRGQSLGQNHCASTFHRLTLDCTEAGSDIWFIVAASHVSQMEARLAAESRPIFMSAPELLSSPFPVFRHVQSTGDLLFIPPRCYAQNLREGSSTSVSWSRMSIYGLGLALHSELPMYRRLCRPEVYNVRKVVYTTMKSHTSRVKEFHPDPPSGPSLSHPDDCHPISRMADELRELIQLFDDILLEGYSDDHASLFLPDYMARDPTCHYCGSSLFLSYFSCGGTCFDLETDSPHTDTSIRVCGACYVEGRSCDCEAMNPRRLRNFSKILQERNDAASTLSDFLASRLAPVDDLSEISERHFSWPRIAVFQAAMELWKLTRDATEIERRGRTCTPRGGERSHTMPPNALINCKNCHAARCFRHILKGNVHSSEALLAIAADTGGIVWHQLHQTARRRRVLSHWTQGRSVGLAEQLVFFASNFSGTSPVSGETSGGFYDGHNFRTLAGLESTRGEESSDMPVFPSAPATNSRASSRSTTARHSEEETSNRPPATVGRAGRYQTGCEVADAGASAQRSKRPRNTESQDEAEYPSKRIRLPGPSTRTLRAANSRLSVIAEEAAAQEPPQPQWPVTSQSEGVQDQVVEPTGGPAAATSQSTPTTVEQDNQPVASTSKADRTATLQRRPTRTGSSSSFSSRFASATSIDRPLAFNFFNPATDLRRGESSVPHPSRIPETERGPANLTPAIQQPHRLDSLFYSRSSMSLPTLNPLAPPLPPQTRFRAMSIGGPSSFTRVVNDYPRPTRTSRSLTPQEIARELAERQNSQQELDAQRILGSMKGDSLSQENLEGYIELLQASGAFDQPM